MATVVDVDQDMVESGSGTTGTQDAWVGEKRRINSPLQQPAVWSCSRQLTGTPAATKGDCVTTWTSPAHLAALGPKMRASNAAWSAGKLSPGSGSSLDRELCRSPECVGSGSVEGVGGLRVDAQQQQFWQLQ